MFKLDEYYTSRKTLIDLIEKQKKEINYLKQKIIDLQSNR
jgi:hypothetical protein